MLLHYFVCRFGFCVQNFRQFIYVTPASTSVRKVCLSSDILWPKYFSPLLFLAASFRDLNSFSLRFLPE